MPNDGIRLKIILIIEVRKLEFTDFDSHSLIQSKMWNLPVVKTDIFHIFNLKLKNLNYDNTVYNR